MYIAPNTTIYVCNNVPLDDTYDHTLYWENETAQANYFISQRKYSFTVQTYQRVQRGYIRLQRKADDLYDCNYLMLQNTAYGDKWFYAFIKNVEYINNEVSEIQFEIDVMQTWYFDYTLGQCFVEREHTVTDGLYEHTLAENLEIGEEYMVADSGTFDIAGATRDSVFLLTKSQNTSGDPKGSYYNGVYSQLSVEQYELQGGSEQDLKPIDDAILRWVQAGKEAEIIDIHQAPREFAYGKIRQYEINQPTSTVLGWNPKNKKLYSYPYCCLVVSNNNGNAATYKWEYWGTNKATFNVAGFTAIDPTITVYPTNYRFVAHDWDSGLTLKSFPTTAWFGDTYSIGVAQNKGAWITGGMMSAASLAATVAFPPAGGTAALTQSVVGQSLGVANNVTSILAQTSKLHATPDQMYGQVNNSYVAQNLGRNDFNWYVMQIKREYAIAIDNYFTMFGYACHRVKIPNTNARPHWTFTKTVRCVLEKSNLPADDSRKICQIYDKGITFWNNPSEVGQYHLDNSPVSSAEVIADG